MKGTLGAKPPFDNIADLLAVPTSIFAEDTPAQVTSMRDTYNLKKAGGFTADGFFVINATDSSGAQWVARGLPDPHILYATALAVDSVAGNDENDGTPAHPFETWRQLRRRVGPGNLFRAACTITVVHNLPAGDPLTVDFGIDDTTFALALVIQGQDAVIDSGTIGAGGARNRDPNNGVSGRFNGITPAPTTAGDWASYVADDVQVVGTGGNLAGTRFHVGKRESAGTALVSTFLNITTFAEATAQDGNTYNVVRVVTVDNGELVATRGYVIVRGICFKNPPSFSENKFLADVGFVQVHYCSFEPGVGGFGGGMHDFVSAINCSFDGYWSFEEAALFSGIARGIEMTVNGVALNAFQGGNVGVELGFLFIGSAMNVDGGGWAQVLDAGFDGGSTNFGAIRIGHGGFCQVGTLWGTSAATVAAVNGDDSTQLLIVSGTQKLVGSTPGVNDASIAGVALGWARMQAGINNIGGAPAWAGPAQGAWAGTSAFSTLAVLLALPTAAFPDGASVRLNSVLDDFALYKSGGLTVDTMVVVNATDGSGAQWVRRGLPHVKWQSQAAFHLNASIGSDEFDGSSATAPGGLVGPLRTPAELARRLGTPAVVRVAQLDIFVDTSFTKADPFNFTFLPKGSCCVYFHGLETAVYTNSTTGFTAATVLARGTSGSRAGTRPTVTDAAAAWGPNVGNLIKTNEATPRAAWISADLGAGVARTMRWMQNPTPAATLAPTLVDQAPGELFSVYTIPTVAAGHVRMAGSQSNAAQLSLIFESLQLATTSLTDTFTVACDSTNHAKTVNCRLGRFRTVGTGNEFRNYNPYIFSNVKGRCPTGTFFYGGGTGVGGSILNESALCEFDGDFFFEGGALTVADYIPSMTYLGAVGVYHAAGDGITIPEGFDAKMVVDLAGVANVYGTVTAGGSVGLRLKPGAQLSFPVGNAPLVTGAAGDYNVGGTAKSRADVPYVEALNMARMVAY